MEQEQAKELVLKITRSLVDHPERVSVNEIDSGKTVVYELTISKGDIGKIIGKHGKTIDAIRTILNAMAGKNHKRMMLEIIE